LSAVDQLAAFGLASSKRLRRPQCSTDLGIHVDSGAWYLHGSQVGDMVARTDAPSMALSRIPFCLARNGCRIFLGLEQAHPSSPARGLVLGDIGDRLGSNLTLDCRASPACEHAVVAWMGGHARIDSLASFRHFPSASANLAELWDRGNAHHVGSSALPLA